MGTEIKAEIMKLNGKKAPGVWHLVGHFHCSPQNMFGAQAGVLFAKKAEIGRFKNIGLSADGNGRVCSIWKKSEPAIYTHLYSGEIPWLDMLVFSVEALNDDPEFAGFYPAGRSNEFDFTVYGQEK
ncbi:hypothetical protein [Pseudomonas sichuanensis]|uniref:hypothetical protein n=1 Tax=Pseudomonas sichuanensis TaxID=2213015 RepID=UPI000DA6470C|nr:hypothetical protein [Pseudomonas sichuanensis]